MKIERRSYDFARPPVIETREDGGLGTIVGYAAVYYKPGDPATEFRIFDDLVERILPGAFDAALREKDDALGTLNHDFDGLLGRVASGTVRLSSDAVGLRYEIDLPDTSRGRDAKALVTRGDLRGSSFGFTVYGKRGRASFTEEIVGGKLVDYRLIEEVELLDVGPVVRPAYDATTTGLRSVADEASRERIAAERAASRSSRSGDDAFRARLEIAAWEANRRT